MAINNFSATLHAPVPVSTATEASTGPDDAFPSTWWEGWKSGSYNSIYLKPGSNVAANYGYFDGLASQVRITIEK